MKWCFSLILLGLLTLGACKLEPRESDTTEIAIDLPDDFIEFLDAFHTDEEYQKAHVRFPLQGIPAMMDSTFTEGSYYWESEDWVMHKSFDPENDEFDQIFTVFDENIIIERILHINRSMGMERRFAKSEDGWNLIYYAGMNFIRQ